MKTIDQPDTFCGKPLRLSDFRRLPGDGHSACTILPDAEGMSLLYDIQEQLRRLAPMGEDGRRSIWIEALRGAPEEWADYETLLSDGEVSDREDYLDLWRSECPDEVAWYEVTFSCFRDRHVLLLSDGEDALWEFSNRGYSDPQPPAAPAGATDFLSRLFVCISRTVERILEDPAAYNRYLEEHLSFFKRFGSILRKDLFRIVPDSRPCLAEDEITLLSDMAAREGRLLDGLPVMRNSTYLVAWRIAYGAVAGPDAGPAVWPDEKIFGTEHGHDLIYARLSLEPMQQEDGSWYFCLVFGFEEYMEDAVHAAAALAAAGLPVRIQGLEAILDLVSGEDRVEIRPGWCRSCLGTPEMTLQRPYDAETEAEYRALVAAADWYPLPEVAPNPFPPSA